MNAETELCVDYFKSRPAFHRILEQLLRKYKAYGRPAGQICLRDATEAEYEAAHDFFGRPFGAPLQFKVQAFDEALQQSKFQGVALKELLERYFGITIQTNKEIQDQAAHDFSQMLERVSSQVRSKACRDWLLSLNGKSEAGPILRKYMADGSAEPALGQACRGIDWLEAHPDNLVRLAVLSAQATSDPHALDGDRTSGTLFLRALAFRQGCMFPEGAEERDLLYYNGGVLCDSISSTVTQVGLILCREHGEHPAFQAFRALHESCTLTLMNLAELTSGSSPSGRVYLVENQMVFSQLCDQAKRFHSPLICTSGQPQVAVLRLLDLLASSGTQLLYSGDFDAEGLAITARLMARFPGLLHPWHMEAEDYARARSEVKLSNRRLQPLQNMTVPELIPTARAILTQRYAGYQELLIPSLLADLTKSLGG